MGLYRPDLGGWARRPDRDVRSRRVRPLLIPRGQSCPHIHHSARQGPDGANRLVVHDHCRLLALDPSRPTTAWSEVGSRRGNTVPDAILDQRRKAGSPESSIPAHLPVF